MGGWRRDATEIEFLRFFYDKAGYGFGPADADVYQSIKDEFKWITGKTLPEPYNGEYGK